MDVTYTLIVVSLLIIFSYLFDTFARKTKFPSVILLIFLGIGIGSVAKFYEYDIDFFDQILPIMGKVGLILIVLEGALELEISKDKLPIILKGFLAAFVILLLNIIALTYVFQYGFGIAHNSAIIYAIPLSIISSAVAIPSASALLKLDKEFVVYESTFSDILGIMIFNYAINQFSLDHSLIGFKPIIVLLLQIVGIIIASIIVTFLLFELIERIEHNVKFFLIFAILLLVYAIGDYFHLPSLVLIFIFGLIMSNSKTLMPNFLRKYISFSKAEKELHQFHILTAESTFVVRTFFFLIFGLLIPIDSFLEGYMPYFYGIIILLIMLVNRFGYLLVTQPKNTTPLVFMSPRGLISILLFMKIGKEALSLQNNLIDEKVLLIVILGSMMIMLVGTLGGKKKDDELPTEPSDDSVTSETSSTYFDVNEELK